jgi:hypothetical protein
VIERKRGRERREERTRKKERIYTIPLVKVA